MSVSQILFLLVIATTPLQLNKYFFFDFSYILGIPIDYRAITIYLSDFFIVLYLAVASRENFLQKPTFFKKIYFKVAKTTDMSPWMKQYNPREASTKRKKNHWRQPMEVYPNITSATFWLLTFNFYLSAAAFISHNPPSIVVAVKIFEFSLLAIFASQTLSQKNIIKPLQLVLGFSILWQALVIIGQFILQRSLGLWFLGERTFDTTTVTIAHIQILSSQFLRPYGTFPHPNVASAYLVISLIMLASLTQNLTTLKKSPAALIGSVGLFLTFSKSALLTIILALAVKIKNFKTFSIFLFAMIFMAWTFFKVIFESQIASFAERLLLQKAALEIASTHLLFGVGSGNFIAELAKLNLTSLAEIRLLQPVHNLFLLIITENGLIGFLLFLLFLLAVLKNVQSSSKVALFLSLLVFASFDHFFWTLQQGQLVFWLAISYIISANPHFR